MDEVLERGAIAFLYRPRVETFAARALEDVQRFFVLLAAVSEPGRSARVRRIRVGRKRLPDAGRHERFWAYVDRVGATAPEVTEDIGAFQYWTKTRGLRHQPGPRVTGEGAYAVFSHREHVHLAYRLGRAARADEVRDELRVETRASFVVAVFARSVEPGGAPSPERRFVPLRPAHLDCVGSEMVLIGSGASGVRAAVRDADAAAAARAARFDELRRARDPQFPAPLFDPR